MLTTRYEEYNQFVEGLPFVLQVDLKRSRFQRSESNNWHANLEIQICTEGCCTVLPDTASVCGFDNLSFFAKTFKRYIGKLPREYKKQER